jgi:hypothetical protein
MTGNMDIVMRDEDFVLYENEKPLLTDKGHVVSHANARLLRLAITHEINHPGEKFSPLVLLKKLNDAEPGPLFREDRIKAILENDLPFSIHNNTPIILRELMECAPLLSEFIFLNASTFASAFSAFLSTQENHPSKEEVIQSAILKLPIEQQVVLDLLLTEESPGFLPHLLLLTNHLSVTEYAASVLILRVKNKNPGIRESLPSAESFAWMQQSLIQKAVIALDFLTLCKNSHSVSVIQEIINQGENNQTEFKSTLRWDLHQSKKNPDIEYASLKTLCAFLNSDGGDLLIGVRDDGSIEGIETDQFINTDKFYLHLWSLIKSSLGQEVVEWIKTTHQQINRKTVCRVHCLRASRPVFLKRKGNDEAFYVRTGPASSNLDIRSALKYIQQHF